LDRTAFLNICVIVVAKFQFLQSLCLVMVSFTYNKDLKDAIFLIFILVKNSTCFGEAYCPSSVVLILYSQQLVLVILVMVTVCWRGLNGLST